MVLTSVSACIHDAAADPRDSGRLGGRRPRPGGRRTRGVAPAPHRARRNRVRNRRLGAGSALAPFLDVLLFALPVHERLPGGGGAGRGPPLLPPRGSARPARDEPLRSRAATWLGAVLRASAVADVVALDVHSPLVHELFPIPLRSLSPARLFAATLAALGLGGGTD